MKRNKTTIDFDSFGIVGNLVCIGRPSPFPLLFYSSVNTLCHINLFCNVNVKSK